jgi:hypothetical protein
MGKVEVKTMKQLTKYNRVAGYLNSLYDKLNADFFNSEMERPVITIQSTPKAFGHYTLYDAWTVNGNGIQEINIGAGTLSRPIENVCATLLHEMIHQYNAMHNIKDVSRGGMYHNKHFKLNAESRGLVISRSEKYGWSITEPSDALLDWILLNDLTDIPMNRNEFSGFWFGGRGNGNGGVDGNSGNNGGNGNKTIKKGSYRKYICPVCLIAVRATKEVNVKCGDCDMVMIKEGA